VSHVFSKKMTKSPFVGQRERVSELLGLIHLDVCGPIKVMVWGGYIYFVTFTDYLLWYG